MEDTARGLALAPLFLKLAGRRVVLVGGGLVAASKLRLLLDAGADVIVVAPEWSGEIAASRATLVRRGFVPGDLDGAWLAVAAAPPAVNRAVAAAAEERRIFVNAVDDPSNASAYLGGVVRRAGMTVAISTDGDAPALAGLLREAFDRVLPDDLERWMDVARAERRFWKAAGTPMAERRGLLLDALNAIYDRAPAPAGAGFARDER